MRCDSYVQKRLVDESRELLQAEAATKQGKDVIISLLPLPKAQCVFCPFHARFKDAAQSNTDFFCGFTSLYFLDSLF